MRVRSTAVSNVTTVQHGKACSGHMFSLYIKYECRQCDYKATQVINLKRHQEAVHDGIKYDCQQCQQKFSQKGHLSVHMKSKHA